MSNTQPLVSICMPAYNVAEVVDEALRSILRQTYHNIEVIVVDDGSTDETGANIQAFADERLHYVRNSTNLGGFQTMNKAMELAKGEFIAVYHTDDVYEPTIVEKEVAYLIEHPQAGAVFCMDHYMDYEGNVYGGTSLPAQFREQNQFCYEEVFPFLLRNKNILLRCPTFMTRCEAIESVGVFDPDKYDIAADLDMWIRILRHYPIGILSERLMGYRHGRQQWSSRYKNLRTTQELYFDIMDYYLEADGWASKLNPNDLIEYEFQRCDDGTFRAANAIIKGELALATELLKQPYPWRTLANSVTRRKLRVLLSRFVIKMGLAIGANRPLTQLLIQTEYGGSI